MRLARVGAITAAILAVATVASAQKPDFSGTWTLDPSSAQAAGGGSGGALGNGPATVTQTAQVKKSSRTIPVTVATPCFAFARPRDCVRLTSRV